MRYVKHTYHHKDLRNALIDEAIVMLGETGGSNVTLRELARRLGVTHTAPYAHFSDKAALLKDVAEAGFEQLARALTIPGSAGASPSEAFVEMGIAYVRFALSSPNLYRLMFVDQQPLEDCGPVTGPDEPAAFGLLLGAMDRLEAPASADRRHLAVVVWSLVHGIAMLEIDRRIAEKSQLSAEELVIMASKVFMRGLREPEQSVLAPQRGSR